MLPEFCIISWREAITAREYFWAQKRGNSEFPLYEITARYCIGGRLSAAKKKVPTRTAAIKNQNVRVYLSLTAVSVLLIVPKWLR